MAASTNDENVGSEDERGCFGGEARREAARVRGLEVAGGRCAAGAGSPYISAERSPLPLPPGGIPPGNGPRCRRLRLPSGLVRLSQTCSYAAAAAATS